MKKIKIYIVTYRRNDILNKNLKMLFESDFLKHENTQVNIINNHSDMEIKDEFKDKVRILHNMTRPDWSCGNLSENYNQALIDGFRNLTKPDSEIVVTLQNDALLCKNWTENLLKMHKKYTFIVGQLGDTIISYKSEAVKKIGMWDENFVTVQHKEADYFVRALIFNKSESCINDILHRRLLNNHDALLLDETRDQNIKIVDGVTKKLSDGTQHDYIKKRMTRCSALLVNYFRLKWKGTWKEDPPLKWMNKKGFEPNWYIGWSQDFVDNPPSPPKNFPIFIRYPYFEKDIYDLKGKGYVVPDGNWYETYGGDKEHWSDVK